MARNGASSAGSASTASPARSSVRGAALGAVHAHAALFDPILQAGAAVGGQMLVQEMVKPLAGISLAGGYNETGQTSR